MGKKRYSWDRSSLKSVPTCGGVYKIHGPVGERAGQSNNLRRRLLEHYERGTESHGLVFPLEVEVQCVVGKKARLGKEKRIGGR